MTNKILYNPFNESWSRRQAKRLLTNVFLRPKEKLLDLGCGAGEFVRQTANKFPQSEVFGLDVSENMIEKALNYSPFLPNTNFELGLAEQLPWLANFFSAISSIDAFHHFTDPNKAIAETYRVLRPYGKIYIYDYFRDSLVARILEKYFRKIGDGHTTFWPSSFLPRLLKQNGFQKIKIQSGPISLVSALKV
ncbi:MAG: methyltransferase domain-containing protein [bacterium]